MQRMHFLTFANEVKDVKCGQSKRSRRLLRCKKLIFRSLNSQYKFRAKLGSSDVKQVICSMHGIDLMK